MRNIFWSLMLLLSVAHAAPDTVFTIDPKLLDDTRAIMRSARVVPYSQDGRMQGFRVMGVRPGRFADLVGFRSGDVVVAVDDRALDSPQAVMALGAFVRGRKQVVVKAVRRGQPAQWTVKFVPGTPLPETASGAPQSAKQIGPEEYVLDAKAIAAPDWNAGLRVIPHYRNGQSQGFKLVGVRTGSFARQLGLRSGDVIKTVNGRSIDSTEAALQAYSTLRGQSVFQIELERRGQPKQLKIRVEGTLPKTLPLPVRARPLKVHGQVELRAAVDLNQKSGAIELVWRDARIVDGPHTWSLGTIRFDGSLSGRQSIETTLQGGDLQGTGRLSHRFSGLTADFELVAIQSPEVDARLTENAAFDAERRTRIRCADMIPSPRCEFAKRRRRRRARP